MSNQAELLQAARNAQKKAYAPYSSFKVGAALIDEHGKIHTGCNVENSSYGATVCAERNAIGAMIAAGGTRIKEVTVVTDLADGCPPCGICRQVLREFAAAADEVKVHLAGPNGVVRTVTVDKLLPEAFDQAVLARHEKNR